MKLEIAPELANNRVLVVDDDRSITLLMATILKRAGFKHVTTANNGLKALELMGMKDEKASVSEAPYDIILLDIMMPEVNGFDLCRQIRKVWGDSVVVMLVTGYEIENHHARYIDSGADDFLSKPVNPNELIDRMSLGLARHAKNKKVHPNEISAKQMTSELGFSSIGNYRIIRTMSWSGSVVVYEAQAQNGRRCVIKILTKQAMEYDDVVKRFKREIELLDSFHHPNVIELIDSDSHHGLDYFVTEYIDGTNLEAHTIDNPHLEMGAVYHFAWQMASALAHVHSMGVIHRDVKLKNMFLDNDGTVKMGDFGIALTKGDVRLTQPGYAIGTPIYMAPEQFEGGDMTVMVDVYSFGASMYHLTTGLPPFTAGNAMELLRKHLREKPRSMLVMRDTIPEAWNELITVKCLAKKPEDRPHSMEEVMAFMEEKGLKV